MASRAHTLKPRHWPVVKTGERRWRARFSAGLRQPAADS